MTIRIRILVLVNLLATAVAVVVGWRSIAVVSSMIEQRLVEESVASSARLCSEMHLPASDRLMHQLGQVLECGVAVVPVDSSKLAASNLSPDAAAAVEAQLAQNNGKMLQQVRLPNGMHRVGTARIQWGTDPQIGQAQTMALMLFMSQARLDSAKRHAAWQIVMIAVSAIALATLMGLWLSSALSRPIRDLARRMDVLGQRLRSESVHAIRETEIGDIGTPRSPAEVSRLSAAFDRLLTQLAETQTRLDRAARLAATGKMSAAVAHELRNPLSGIKMNARLLQDEEGLSADGAKSVQLIEREIERMDLFIEELMALREPDTQEGSSPAAQATYLDEVINGVVELFADRAQHAGISLLWEQRKPSVRVAMEVAPLRQVILNLVANAFDATPPNGSIRLEIEETEAGNPRLWVVDSGPGVTDKVADTLFEPFVSTKERGAGLGLYVCRRIMECHGGRIGYDTVESGGRFWLEIPKGQTT